MHFPKLLCFVIHKLSVHLTNHRKSKFPTVEVLPSEVSPQGTVDGLGTCSDLSIDGLNSAERNSLASHTNAMANLMYGRVLCPFAIKIDGAPYLSFVHTFDVPYY